MSLREGQVPGFEFLFNKIIDSFSGGVYDPWWGTYGAMIFTGGGHASTYDNSVLMLDYNDLTFKRLSNASPPTAYNDWDIDPLFNVITGEYGDGQRGSGHSFDMLSILPPSQGGAEAGTLFAVSGQGVHARMNRSNNWAHRFDIRRNMIMPANRGRWAGATDSAPTDYRSPGACSAYDPTRKRIWWISALYSQPPLIRYLDIDRRRQETVRFVSYSRVAPHGDSDSITLRYHAALDIVILSCTAFDIFTMAYLHCSRPEEGWIRPTLSAQIPSSGGRSYPFDYVPEIDRYVMLAPADQAAVYEIQVPADPTNLWNVTRRPFRGLTNIPFQRVAGKRWSYAPAVKAFVWLARAEEPLYVYRPLGT
jgi:hypothetical protein